MIKKALVITNGQIEQLQAGDRLASPDLTTATNGNAGALPIGTPVYVSAGDTVDKAKADAAGTKDVFGLVADVTIAIAGSGAIQTDGSLVATTGQWDAVTGQTGGLTPGSFYYLSAATAGMLSPNAPTMDGQFVAPVGKAKSTTELEITILSTIKL